MGLLTYDAKFGGKEIRIKARKEEAQRFASSLNNLLKITYFCRHLTGIIGVTEGWNKEDQHTTMTLGLPCGQPLPDPEGYAKDLEAFKAQVPGAPAVIEGERLQELWKAAADLLKKHMPVVDERKTPEQHAEQIAESNKLAAEREQKEKEREARDASETEALKKQYPYLVTIKASGKSSHACGTANLKTELQRAFPGVDFSIKSRSFSMGSDINIAWVDGPTSKQVKEISAKYCYEGNRSPFPNIFGSAKYVFENRTESYPFLSEIAASLGFVLSPEEVERIATQRGTDLEGRTWQTIREAAWETPKLPEIKAGTEAAPSTAGGVTVRMNTELNGVEILFSEKPEAAVIASLKANGFRWSPKGKLWYAKQSDSRVAFAHSLQGQEVAA